MWCTLWLGLCVVPAIGLSQGRRTVPRSGVVARAAPTWPWSESVAEGAPLLYMRFLEHQLEALTALGAVELEMPPSLAYADCAKPARVASRRFEVPGLFRSVRMTYFDGGHGLQVFNSLWYPAFERRDAPLLGIDLLSFGDSRKLLCVIDAQPPGGRDADGGVAHDGSCFAAIRDAGPSTLRGEVSARWYDDSRYFSPQMLYTRFEDDGAAAIEPVLLPAFEQYLAAYVDLVRDAPTDADPTAAMAHHAEYDAFNAARDPAHKLFKSYFGDQFADDFVHDFLFAFSERPAPEPATTVPTDPVGSPRE